MAQRTFWRFSEDLDSFLESNKMKEKLKEYLSTHDIDNDIATEVKKVRAGRYLLSYFEDRGEKDAAKKVEKHTFAA